MLLWISAPEWPPGRPVSSSVQSFPDGLLLHLGRPRPGRRPLSGGHPQGRRPHPLRPQRRTGGAQQADLLVCGEYRLNGRVGDGVIVQQGQHHGYRRAVVAAQSGVFRPQPVAVQDQRQRVLFEIVVCAGGLDAYHVRVPLEDHRRMPLIAGGGVLPDDHVAQFVPAAAEAPRSGEVLHPRADGVRVPRLPGDAAQFLEKPEYVPGLQMG